MPSGEKWRKREKPNDKEHEKASLFHIAEYSNGFCFVLFYEKTSPSLPMLFVHVGKTSSEAIRSSRSQMYF